MASKDTFTAEVPKETEEHPDFKDWIAATDGSQLKKIEAALKSIRNSGIVTSAKDLGDGLYEKKWKSGLRLYFAVVENEGKKTLLVVGSRKGKGQKAAIKKSKSILVNYNVSRENIKKA